MAAASAACRAAIAHSLCRRSAVVAERSSRLGAEPCRRLALAGSGSPVWRAVVDTRTGLVGAQLSSRRTYVDSADYTITVRSLEDPLDVLKFMAEHRDSDVQTHEAALRTLSRLTPSPNLYKAVVEDGRFHAILSSLASRLDDCDARVLSMIAHAASRFRTSTPELSELAQRLAEVVTRREDTFSPRNLATIAMALSVRGVRDVTTIEFVKAEALKRIDDMEPAQCIMLLEAFRLWGSFDRQLVDMVVERMSDEVDRFTAADVVEAIAGISRLGLARGFLLRRLCTLAFDNLRQFTPRELTKLAYSLAKLRFLARSNVDDIVDAVQPELYRLKGSQLSELLFALAMADARHQVDFARSVVDQYVAFGASEGSHRTLSSLIDFLWSLCALDLVSEYEKEFKAVLAEVVNREKPPQNRVPLMKLFDVLCALDLHYKGLDVAVPPVWRAACDDADRFEMDRLESSRLHGELLMRFDSLRGSANGTRWQLQMQRNHQCGPFRVDLFDEGTKVVLDIETIAWPTSKKMKHRFLGELGYKTLLLDYWDWRRARTEEDQSLFLKSQVTRLLEAS